MYADIISTECRNVEGTYVVTMRTDREAAETIKFFVDALMGRTKPVVTDQGHESGR